MPGTSRFIVVLAFTGMIASACTSTVRSGTCGSDADCKSREICQKGLCIQVECKQDSDCQQGLSCVENECMGSDCESDDDCDVGEICVQGQCADGCKSQRDCLEGMVCAPDQGEHGLCVQCVVDADCEQDLSCVNNLCRQHCTSDQDCDVGTCDAQTNTCVECSRDDHCDFGYICEQQLCVEGCRKDRDCPEGNICVSGSCTQGCRDDGDCAQGVCDEATSSCVDCLKKTDCEPGNVCLDRSCVTGCEVDEDCPVEMLCAQDLGQNGTCVQCLVDDDCLALEKNKCLDNQCVFQCTQDDDCLPEQYCADDHSCMEGCRSEQSCDFMQLCSDRNCSDAYSEQAPYCKACDSRDLLSCGSMENSCLMYPFSDDEFSQSSGEYCAPSCSDGQPCPNGFECGPVIGIKQSDICHQAVDCPGNLPCLKPEGADTGYCPCHDTLNPCQQNTCFIDTCGLGNKCTALSLSGLDVPCQTDADCHVCTQTLEPCGENDACPAIECEKYEDVDYGGCVLDRACSLTEGNHCPVQ